MATFPKVLRNFSLWVGTTQLRGLVNEAQIPELEAQLEEYRAGGMNSNVAINMGTTIGAMTFKSNTLEADVAQYFGTSVLLRFLGSERHANKTDVPIEVEIEGILSKVTPPNGKTGDKGEAEYEIQIPTYYKYLYNGGELFYIDVNNMIERINTVDRLAAERSNIGL